MPIPSSGRSTGLATESRGEGPALLWGHGLLQDRATENVRGPFPWDSVQVPGTRLIRWDARGHGSSPAATRSGGYRWPALARDALAVADAAGEQVFSIGGASLGAATALWAAVLAPERVDRLVLALPPAGWGVRSRPRTLYRVGGILSTFLPDDDTRRRATILRGTAESDYPSRDRVRGVNVPVLVLGWRHDPLHPHETAEELARTLPVADLHLGRRPLDTTGWLDRLQDFLRR